MRKFALLAVLAILPTGLFAARLELKDGTVLYGKLLSGSPENILFLDENGASRRFDLSQIRDINFEAAGPNQSASSANREAGDNNANRQASDNNSNRYGTANRAQSSDVIPAGASLSVRTDETIDQRSAAERRTYPATVTEDVLDGAGAILIPRGSQAQLVVRQANQGGTLTSGNLVLDLDSVTVNGRRYQVSTENLTQTGSQGIGKNKRTAEMVGGGAVLGTLLGAIAGGGKGAAIGAAAGAATGGGVQVLTKGDQIRVPAETVLTFRLDAPLRLRPM